MSYSVTKDTLIGEIIREDMGAGQVLAAYGMHCFMCPSAQGESLEEAAQVHEVPAEELVSAVNNYFASKK
ncbi:MAG: DUF1858 domain-containing protein [Eubacteriales bacterium]|nr:DUF1858 domain-containing protein [Eubacteriales bacterium]